MYRQVKSPYPEGLSTTLATIERLCGDEPEIIDFLAAAKRGKVGRPPTVTGQTDARGNVIETMQNLHNKTYRSSESIASKINRLREHAPQYHAKVMSGELSVDGAYVKAGFKPKRRAVNMDDAQSAYNTLKKHMQPEILRELVALLKWREFNKRASKGN